MICYWHLDSCPTWHKMDKLKLGSLVRLKAYLRCLYTIKDVHNWCGRCHNIDGLDFHSDMHIIWPWTIFLEIVLELFLSINDPAAGFSSVYYLDSCHAMKEGLEHVLFDEYFLCIGRVNKVYVANLDIGNAKVDLFPRAVGDKRNILVIPNSQSNEKNCTYRAVAVIRKPSVEGVYVQSLVKLLFMMQPYDFIH